MLLMGAPTGELGLKLTKHPQCNFHSGRKKKKKKNITPPKKIFIQKLSLRIPFRDGLTDKVVFNEFPASLHTLVRDPRLCLTPLDNWNLPEASRPHWTGVYHNIFFFYSSFLSFLFLGRAGSVRCPTLRNCRQNRLQPAEFYRLEIRHLNQSIWAGQSSEGPSDLPAFPSHVLRQILNYLPPDERSIGFLNLLRLCGQVKKTDQRYK